MAARFPSSEVDTVLDLLDLLDLAWHDCYGETAPPPAVAEDVLVVGDGDLGRTIRAGHLAVIDWRDLRLAADSMRRGGQPGPPER